MGAYRQPVKYGGACAGKFTGPSGYVCSDVRHGMLRQIDHVDAPDPPCAKEHAVSKPWQPTSRRLLGDARARSPASALGAPPMQNVSCYATHGAPPTVETRKLPRHRDSMPPPLAAEIRKWRVRKGSRFKKNACGGVSDALRVSVEALRTNAF